MAAADIPNFSSAEVSALATMLRNGVLSCRVRFSSFRDLAALVALPDAELVEEMRVSATRREWTSVIRDVCSACTPACIVMCCTEFIP